MFSKLMMLLVGIIKYAKCLSQVKKLKNNFIILVIIEKLKREVKILELIKGHENIVEFDRVVIDRVSRTPSLVFKYLNHQEETSNYLSSIKDSKELKVFLKGILDVSSIFILIFIYI